MKDACYSESVALETPKKLGEKVIREVIGLNLLNASFKIRSDKSKIYIPLSRKPTSRESIGLREKIGEYKINLQKFARRQTQPQNLASAMGKYLSPSLRASLPSSADFIGDLAVLDLPEILLDYSSVIAKALLEFHKKTKTVLIKTSAVEGRYRLRQYKIAAGQIKTHTLHKENGCTYHLDLREVYFSPRLSYEHSRVASQVRPNETVIDMFAGIGPFSILIGKRLESVRVYALDLNPAAIKFLTKNVLINSVAEKVIPLHCDAQKMADLGLLKVADRVIMNLPEKSFKYIDVSVEALKPRGGIVHYYAFAGFPNPIEKVKKDLYNSVKNKGKRIQKFIQVRCVREVAPRVWQVVVDARIT